MVFKQSELQKVCNILQQSKIDYDNDTFNKLLNGETLDFLIFGKELKNEILQNFLNHNSEDAKLFITTYYLENLFDNATHIIAILTHSVHFNFNEENQYYDLLNHKKEKINEHMDQHTYLAHLFGKHYFIQHVYTLFDICQNYHIDFKKAWPKSYIETFKFFINLKSNVFNFELKNLENDLKNNFTNKNGLNLKTRYAVIENLLPQTINQLNTLNGLQKDKSYLLSILMNINIENARKLLDGSYTSGQGIEEEKLKDILDKFI